MFFYFQHFNTFYVVMYFPLLSSSHSIFPHPAFGIICHDRPCTVGGYRLHGALTLLASYS